MVENTESQEMYLATIYALHRKNGIVRCVDVAEERGYCRKVNVRERISEEFADYVAYILSVCY